jgi:hypothetical protein
MKKLLAFVFGILLLAVSAQAGGEEQGWSAAGGIGFEEGLGGSFLLSFEAPYRFGGEGLLERLSVGPLLQLGFDQDRFTLLISANSRLTWDLEELVDVGDGFFKNVNVFGQAGLGFSHESRDRHRHRTDNAFLINFGAGADYTVNEHLTLTSNMLINLHAGGLFHNSVSLSWQMIGARYSF